jgi:hypothetical protein
MALANYFVHPSAFCWNPKCSEYGKVKQGNIRRFGRTQAGTQRFQCKTCKHTFVETIGTVFYGRHTILSRPSLSVWRLWPNETAWRPSIGSKA